MSILFLAWQDPVRRRWFTVGRLLRRRNKYVFTYTKGARAAQKSGFEPLVSFPVLEKHYESDEIFPLFANAVLSPNRPEYTNLIKWLSISHDKADPIAILARTGGNSMTETLEIFPCPEPDSDNTYLVHFFVRGLRHQSPCAIDRVKTLKPGEELLLMADLQNPHDPNAYALRTAEQNKNDMHLLGYLPRYLAGELKRFERSDITKAIVEVVQVNASPAPIHFRVLCRMRMPWPEGHVPFSTEEYQPLNVSDKSP